MNKVEIMGKVSHLEPAYQEINGENILILRFVVEVAREGSKTQIDTIPCRIAGDMAEQVHDNIQNGDIVSVKGRWNVDRILTPEGEIKNYCSCIPSVLMLAKEKGKGGMTYQ